MVLSLSVVVFASEEYFIRSNHGTTHVYQDRPQRPVIRLKSRYVAPPIYSSALYAPTYSASVPAYSRAYYPAPIVSAPMYAPSLGWGSYGWGGQAVAMSAPIGYGMSDYFLKK